MRLLVLALLIALAPLASAQSVQQTQKARFRVEYVASGLQNPWAVAFLPEGRMLVTERPGRLRMIGADGRLQRAPVRGTPEVWAQGQGGLLDVEPHPKFAENGWIYLAYSKPEAQGAMTAIVRGRLRDGAWVDQEAVYTVPAAEATRAPVHFGCRVRFGPDGMLYFAIGDRGRQDWAQDLARHNGKVFRLRDDGSVPADNPFAGRDDALAAAFSYGHRNPQSLEFHPATGELWETEHGPRGGDELNIVRPGRNYGWPVITYGVNYDGSKISDLRAKEGMEQPLHHWTPSIAPSGMAFYTASRFPGWRGSLFVGALAHRHLQRLELDGEKVVAVEKLLVDIGRVRDVRQGPDGLIYVVLDEPGRLLRLSPEP